MNPLWTWVSVLDSFPMPEFMQTLATAAPQPPIQVLGRLLAALALGGLVAWIYKATRSASEGAPSIPKTLVLLSVLIAMVTQIIGTNVALAFSLVGALSIVRFRTVVRDTQDTAFVICAVVVGMAVGANHWWVAGIGLSVIALAAFVMRSRPSPAADAEGVFTLAVRVGLGHDAEALLGTTLDAALAERRLMSMATARQGMSIDMSYEVRLRKDGRPDELVKALNRIEGVQSVELKRRAEEGV
jgi:branched-subunit amino acid transport protein AzlD